MVYVGKMNMPYTETTNFKEKEAQYINTIIYGGHIRDYVSFAGYANMFFDNEDTKHWNPKFVMLNGFTRNKSNVLAYNLHNCTYDKMFIYKVTYKQDGFFGIIIYDTKTCKSVNIFNIENDYSKLIINIYKMISHKKIN